MWWPLVTPTPSHLATASSAKLPFLAQGRLRQPDMRRVCPKVRVLEKNPGKLCTKSSVNCSCNLDEPYRTGVYHCLSHLELVTES